jgi:hypothetical protein
MQSNCIIAKYHPVDGSKRYCSFSCVCIQGDRSAVILVIAGDYINVISTSHFVGTSSSSETSTIFIILFNAKDVWRLQYNVESVCNLLNMVVFLSE